MQRSQLFQSGADLALEYIRQKCIFNNFVSGTYVDQSWWEYASHLPEKCSKGGFTLCSKEIHEELNFNYQQTEQ
jgi:hypothetical protein